MHIGDLGKSCTGHEVGFKPGQVGKLFSIANSATSVRMVTLNLSKILIR